MQVKTAIPSQSSTIFGNTQKHKYTSFTLLTLCSHVYYKRRKMVGLYLTYDHVTNSNNLNTRFFFCVTSGNIFFFLDDVMYLHDITLRCHLHRITGLKECLDLIYVVQLCSMDIPLRYIWSMASIFISFSAMSEIGLKACLAALVLK